MKKYLAILLLPFLCTQTASAENIPASNLALGMRGNEVKSLQLLLEEKGYLEANNHTGYFGIKTLSAVKDFQKKNGISPTGLFGKLSRQKMNELNIALKPIGGDKDSHGCYIGAGYSWGNEQQACIRPWEHVTNTLISSSWNISTLDSKATSGFTFSIKDGNLSMHGCNSIGGPVVIDEANKTIKTDRMISTMMACLETEKMQLDQIASSVFASATVEILPDSTIRISNQDHSLVFKRSN